MGIQSDLCGLGVQQLLAVVAIGAYMGNPGHLCQPQGTACTLNPGPMRWPPRPQASSLYVKR